MTFIGDFQRYLRTRTDAPPDFHLHAGMVTLATAAGNRIWCDGWSRPVYPNVYVVVIAKSGMGKSVSLDYSQSLIERAGLGDHVLSEGGSQEALIDELKKAESGTFYAQEFASLMALLGREYNAGLMEVLTQLYDVPERWKRVLRSGAIELTKPCPSIFGASSPDWFASSYKASMLAGGFLARFLFCPRNTPGRYVGHPGPRDNAAETVLADHLRSVATLAGRVDFSGVWGRFNAWDERARRMTRDECPPEFAGMRSRAGLMVLKAAMLFHVSRTTKDLRVSEADLDNAITYVEQTHREAERYLSEEVAHDKDDADCLRVLEILDRYGGRADRSRVLTTSHMGAPRLDRAERTLKESGRLTVRMEERTRWYELPGMTNGHVNGAATLVKKSAI